MDVYLEIGSKRVFAGATEWPGWCRSARDEAAAQRSLVDAGARFARALRGTRLGFTAPKRTAELTIVERLDGDATTDFGAPSIPPAVDARPFTEGDHDRHARILRAAWRALDRAAAAADGAALSKGPRGGGRDLDAIVAHVVGSDAGYGRMIGATTPDVDGTVAIAARDEVRAALLDGLRRAAQGGIPERGPRGGARWTARYFVRRAAWHALDHAWEIEDRS